MQNSLVSVMLHTPKQEFQLGSHSVAAFPPSSNSDHCDLMSEAINCPLPVSVDGVLDASQSGQIGPENQSSSNDICLGSESFLQSLEAIPLPLLGQSEATMYNPMTRYPDQHTNTSKAKHLSSCSAALQQEILQAWGSAGPPTNFNTSPGVGFVQIPFASGENPVAPLRGIPRAIRSRGRGRGMRRKIAPSHAQSRVRSAPLPAFSPSCGSPVCQASIRTETMTTQAQSYLTMMSSQLPAPNQSNGSLSLDVTPARQTCNRQSSETAINSEENQANEKMNAYIEKFSSESCEMFGPLISVDTSRKPSTLQEAISMYIDFIVLENEKRTRISCCNVLPMPLDFHKEDYYHEIMCQPIAFPTPKFRDWLKLYNVDIEITDPDGQTVSQTTFPPSANFTDTRVNIPTSMHMINWQQTRGIPAQPQVLASPRLNIPGVLRGRPKCRAVSGQAVRFGYPGLKGVVGNPPFDFLQNSLGDGESGNIRFVKANGTNCGGVHPASLCTGGVHQFQTISLPTLGSMQYFGQGPLPANIPRPCPDVSASSSLQMISSFPGAAAAAHASNYYRMGPLFNPYPNEMAWRNCCTRTPNLLLSDPNKANTYTEMDAENMTTYMNRPESLRSADNTMLVPSVLSMLPPFSSFVNGSSANQSNESVKCYLPVQSSESRCSKTCQIGEPAVYDHLQALSFARGEQERTGVLSLPSVGMGGHRSAGEPCFATVDQSQGPRFNWNDAKLHSRPGSGSVIKEMVDQGSQTEIEKVVAEDEKTFIAGGGTTMLEEEEDGDQGKEREEFALDTSICGFSCNDDIDEGRKTEDQLNSEILLRNASIILNGSMEADEEVSIEAMGFASQEHLLNNSQASTLGDLDGLTLSGDCAIHSFMTVSLTCSSEDPPQTSDEMRSSPGDKLGVEYDVETVSEGVVLNKSSDLLLEVGSNVEINTEGVATVGGDRSEYRLVEPRRKRARFSRMGYRQVIVPGRQDTWPNTGNGRHQQGKQTTEHSQVDATGFEAGDESVGQDL